MQPHPNPQDVSPQTLTSRYARVRDGFDSWGQPLPTGKVCRHCNRDLDFAAFPANKKGPSGLSSWCRECHAEANREWRARKRAS
jgi:hypothetical protein